MILAIITAFGRQTNIWELLFFALVLDGVRRFAVWIYKLIKKLTKKKCKIK